MSLVTPLKVGKLQQALHVKAKEEPEFRFYQLYDKVYRWDVLVHAYRLCRANAGAAGVDGLSFDKIESKGLRKWLEELAVDLRKKTYSADPVRRVWIPKANGKERPLGIPTVRDRVVQTAVVLVLEPNIRGRPATGAICLSPPSQCTGCGKACASISTKRLQRGRRRRFVRLL